ncbi:Wadjet anti-phage system protein JetD domain-containing protein [Salinisphaera sp. SWV1]|uniref:Wadjet anti-phage system protein JetD domain-containing protein n=1 Tax=Salinisphaera sp. SWV1 TaxID=3454139 RepID=UPI003F8796AF
MGILAAGIRVSCEKRRAGMSDQVKEFQRVCSDSGIVTGDSAIVTTHSGPTLQIGHDETESAVTFARNRRSRSIGMTGHDGPEYALGLVKHPQPVLIAGRHQIRLQNERTVALHEPYIGLAPDHVCGIAGDAPAHIMTIENLTTFNEVARGLNDEVDAMVIYTGGMPSPALRAALRALIADCGERTCFWHWGDIDVGGLRTALAIQGELDGRARLRPWQMDLSILPSDTRLTDAPDTVVKQMITLAERLDWPEEAAGIRRLRAIVEQEVLAPCRPF